jgi:carboxyl-terminal processing protease
VNHDTRTRRRVTAAALAVPLVLALASAAASTPRSAPPTAQRPPACAAPTSAPQPVTPTTAGTIEQAYDCVFAHYYNAAALDDRPLLNGAFAGLTQELGILGLEQPDATAPALTGDRAADWAAFSAVYERVIGHLPTPARQPVAAATMTGMLASLDDNHVHWRYPLFPPGYQPGDAYGLGFTTSPDTALMANDPLEALPPLFVTRVYGGPAAAAGLRPGDVIVAVDGAPPYVDGLPTPGVASLLSQQYPRSEPVILTLRRPATGRAWTMTMKPALFQPIPSATQNVTAKLLNNDIGYVALAGFAPDAADAVLTAIADLRAGRTLRGVVLDLRGNGGGSPQEVARLLGAFVHGKAYSYDCASPDNCAANDTDGTVPLLHLPLVVLTDRDCASACDAFSGAVKDLHLGSLVGTRTSGIVAGPAEGYLLDDNSMLLMPFHHELGADHETINGIGVAPDHYLPLTPQDVSTGHDPDIDQALKLLG